MKALILFASPHKNGNTATLVNEFIKNFQGESEIVYLYPHFSEKAVKACIDCGGCKYSKGCVIEDDFKKLTADDYDNLVIASPIYMSNLPPVLWNVISRFNFGFYNKTFLKEELSFKAKRGILLLTGGGFPSKKLMGESNEELAMKESEYIFSKLNCSFDKNTDFIFANNTDDLLVKDNTKILEATAKLAKNL